MQRQRRVLALRDLALHIRDLVLGLLRVELDDAWAAALGIRLASLSGFALFVFWRLDAFGCRVDVGVGVQRGVVGGDDGVPDNGLGGRDCGGRGGGVRGGDVEEDLLSVPVEEGGQVCDLGQWCYSMGVRMLFATRTGIQVELDMRVFFSLRAVIVRSALDDLHVLELQASTGRLRDEQHAHGDCGRDCERGGCEEAEDILEANHRRMHVGGVICAAQLRSIGFV